MPETAPAARAVPEITATGPLLVAVVLLTGLAVGLVSTVVPVLAVEAYVVSAALTTSLPLALGAATAAALGQTVGKVAVFVDLYAKSREIERKTLFLIVSKPISRSLFLTARFAGNMLTLGVLQVAMGVLFGRLYQRWGRVGPLVVAHTLIDVAAFVGHAALAGHVSWLPTA